MLVLFCDMVGCAGVLFTTADTLVRDVDVQPFNVASAKYGVVADIVGVVKLIPEPKALPPLAAANQLIVPVLAPSKVTVPASQRETLFTATVGMGLMVAITAVLEVEKHPFSSAST